MPSWPGGPGPASTTPDAGDRADRQHRALDVAGEAHDGPGHGRRSYRRPPPALPAAPSRIVCGDMPSGTPVREPHHFRSLESATYTADRPPGWETVHMILKRIGLALAVVGIGAFGVDAVAQRAVPACGCDRRRLQHHSSRRRHDHRHGQQLQAGENVTVTLPPGAPVTVVCGAGGTVVASLERADGGRHVHRHRWCWRPPAPRCRSQVTVAAIPGGGLPATGSDGTQSSIWYGARAARPRCRPGRRVAGASPPDPPRLSQTVPTMSGQPPTRYVRSPTISCGASPVIVCSCVASATTATRAAIDLLGAAAVVWVAAEEPLTPSELAAETELDAETVAESIALLVDRPLAGGSAVTDASLPGARPPVHAVGARAACGRCSPTPSNRCACDPALRFRRTIVRAHRRRRSARRTLDVRRRARRAVADGARGRSSPGCSSTSTSAPPPR